MKIKISAHFIDDLEEKAADLQKYGYVIVGIRPKHWFEFTSDAFVMILEKKI